MEGDEAAYPRVKGFDKDRDLGFMRVDLSKPLAITPPVSPNLRDNRDPEKIGFRTMCLRLKGWPTLAAADHAIDTTTNEAA